MYEHLQRALARPLPFQFYTAERLWNDPHISAQMLTLHLDEEADPASRRRSFLDRSVAWLSRYFQVGHGMKIADFGCGPGLYTTALAELGADVTGIDFSQRSIAHARREAGKKGLNIDYRQQNYLDFADDRCFDLITLIYCDYCALSPRQRKTLLGIMHRHLTDGGRLLFDVFSLAAYRQRQEDCRCERRLMDGFWSADDYYGLMKTFRYEDEHLVLDKYSIVEAGRTFVVYNWLQYFSPAVLRAELRESGFDVCEIFADVSGRKYCEEAPEIAVVASKRS